MVNPTESNRSERLSLLGDPTGLEAQRAELLERLSDPAITAEQHRDASHAASLEALERAQWLLGLAPCSRCSTRRGDALPTLADTLEAATLLAVAARVTLLGLEQAEAADAGFSAAP